MREDQNPTPKVYDKVNVVTRRQKHMLEMGVDVRHCNDWVVSDYVK